MRGQRRNPVEAASTVCCIRCPVEDQVAAALELVDRETVDDPAAPLPVEIEREAQTRGIDPGPADLAQPPTAASGDRASAVRARSAGLATAVKQLPALVNAIAAAWAWRAHVLVSVEDYLRAERRLPRHLDGHVPHAGSMRAERLVIDVLGSPFDVDDATSRRPFHRPHRRRGLGDEHQNIPAPTA